VVAYQHSLARRRAKLFRFALSCLCCNSVSHSSPRFCQDFLEYSQVPKGDQGNYPPPRWIFSIDWHRPLPISKGRRYLTPFPPGGPFSNTFNHETSPPSSRASIRPENGQADNPTFSSRIIRLNPTVWGVIPRGPFGAEKPMFSAEKSMFLPKNMGFWPKNMGVLSSRRPSDCGTWSESESDPAKSRPPPTSDGGPTLIAFIRDQGGCSRVFWVFVSSPRTSIAGHGDVQARV
jgi:hypothetical protein